MERQRKHRLNTLAVVACCSIVGLTAPSAAQTVEVFPGGSVRTQPRVPVQLGIDIRDVTAADIGPDKLPAESGAYVSGVWTAGPAEKAGVRRGDVIVEFDGERVRSAAGLQRLVSETPPGRPVKTIVIREGRRVELTVAPEIDSNGFFRFDVPGFDSRQGPFLSPPGRRPPETWNRWYYSFPPNKRPMTPTSPRLGIRVQELTPQLAEYFGTKDGVLVSMVEDDSAASRAGLKAGDIITEIDGRAVSKPDAVAQAVEGHRLGDQMTIGIVRNRHPQTIHVTLGEKRSAENRP